MSDMVERVARRLFAILHHQASLDTRTDFDSEWANRCGDYMGIVVPSRVDQCREMSLGAIREMYTPTNAMTFAGARVSSLPVAPYVWRTMIDSALGEAK